MTDQGKIIYDILCSEEQPPEGQHWEGFVTNKIVVALAQPEPEPVAWWHDRGDVVDLNVSGHGTPLYTAPPKKEWVGLTDKEIEDCLEMSIQGTCRAIEAKLKEKNT